MLKKPCVGTLMRSQHVKGSKTLLKSPQQCFCQILWSLWKKNCSKNVVLEVSEILWLFFNILTPDEKYSLSVKASVKRNTFKCNYLEIEKYFLNFCLNFQNLHKIFRTLKEKMNLRGYWFLKVYTSKIAAT